jgi:hypothetical protein
MDALATSGVKKAVLKPKVKLGGVQNKPNIGHCNLIKDHANTTCD